MKILTQDLAKKVEREVRDGIYEYWINNTIDYKNGGFFGRILNNGNAEPDAPKHLILNIRILWGFSRAYNHFKDNQYLKLAQRAYHYIITNFWDDKNNGLFWELDSKGNVINDRKQIYGQAFGIYAFSEYFKACKDDSVLEFADKLFDAIDVYGLDKEYNGYFEAFSRTWEMIDDVRLSSVDMNEKKSNNTHLHIIEAFTTYYEIKKDKRVKERLINSIDIMLNKIMHRDTYKFTLFFDEKWNRKSDTISYGHEIEAAWLIHEALSAVDDCYFYLSRKPYILTILNNCFNQYLDGKNGINGMYNERLGNGTVDSDKIWWVQAEACVGFFLAYQITGDLKFLKTVNNIWNFIDSYLIDKTNGEWYWYATDEKTKKKLPTKINEWKSLYHNSRACIELLERINLKIREENNE